MNAGVKNNNTGVRTDNCVYQRGAHTSGGLLVIILQNYDNKKLRCFVFSTKKTSSACLPILTTIKIFIKSIRNIIVHFTGVL